MRLLHFTAFLLNQFALLPSFSRLCRKGHNKTCLSHCRNLCLALWPLYFNPFVGLQVVIWEKVGRFLVSHQTTEGHHTRQDNLVSPRFTVDTRWDFPLCPVSPLKELLWFEGCIKYECCQVPWHCLNGSWKDASHWQNQETVMQSP